MGAASAPAELVTVVHVKAGGHVVVLGRDGREPQRAAREAVHGEPERVAAYLRSATERAAADAYLPPRTRPCSVCDYAVAWAWGHRTCC